LNKFSNVIYSGAEFSASLLDASGNHLCCSRNISYYYQYCNFCNII